MNSSASMPPPSAKRSPGATARARHHVGRQHAEHRIVGDRGERRGGGDERERRALAQAQQARGLVDLGAGEHDRARSGCRACRRADADARWRWICARRSGEALISVQRSPSPDTARLACVRARTRLSPAQASRQTVAVAVPLRKAAARRRTEHDGGQAHLTRQRDRRSEFGRQIAVDLKADADLDEGRGRPGHGVSSSSRSMDQRTNGADRCIQG